MKRLSASVIFTSIVIILNWITPFIANSQMNTYLNQDCESISKEPCCNGINAPNFQLEELKFSEKSVSGLYFKIENTKSDYWVRIVSLNVIITALWIPFALTMFFGFYRYSIPLTIIYSVFIILGIISSLTFLVGGPVFKYEFFGMNDSPIYVKNQKNNDYQLVENLYIYKIYGADDCGSNMPIETSLDLPTISRVKINIPVKSSSSSSIKNPCKKDGLMLYANNNFTGIYSRKQVGPWSVEILSPGEHISNVKHSFALVPECVNKMEEIISITSGNLIIPIGYILAVIVSLLFPKDDIPVLTTVVPRNRVNSTNQNYNSRQNQNYNSRQNQNRNSGQNQNPINNKPIKNVLLNDEIIYPPETRPEPPTFTDNKQICASV